MLLTRSQSSHQCFVFWSTLLKLGFHLSFCAPGLPALQDTYTSSNQGRTHISPEHLSQTQRHSIEQTLRFVALRYTASYVNRCAMSLASDCWSGVNTDSMHRTNRQRTVVWRHGVVPMEVNRAMYIIDCAPRTNGLGFSTARVCH